MPKTCPHTKASHDRGFIWRCVLPAHQGDQHFMRRFQQVLAPPIDPIPDALKKADA